MRGRWATQADIAKLPTLSHTARVFVLADGDDLFAVATMLYDTPRGVPSCYLDFLKPVPKVSLHRFGLAAVQAARGLGVASFVACADKTVPRSEAWLERLGMERIGECEKGAIYQCKVALAVES